MPLALYALTAGAFGIGTTEFVIMGLLLQVSDDLGVSISAAGLLISGYALGVVVGAPLLTIATGTLAAQDRAAGADGDLHARQSRLRAGARLRTLMAARVITALAHGTFFGVGSVVATGLVARRQAGLGDRASCSPA